MKVTAHIIIVSIIAVLVVSGCATMFTGTTDTVNFKTDPQGARVIMESTDGLYKEEKATPAIFTIPSNKTYTVTILLEGYKTKDIVLERKISGWVVGDLFIGGIIGLAIDFITGGAYVHDKAVNVKLEKEDLPKQITFRFLLASGKEETVSLPVEWEVAN